MNQILIQNFYFSKILMHQISATYLLIKYFSTEESSATENISQFHEHHFENLGSHEAARILLIFDLTSPFAAFRYVAL